ncbi:MAG: dephospho-CoA kinase [Bdellovibrionales bacterium]|nr:dephospho-CoA kinase [Bdellovibrionales bacterium]
MKLKNKFNRVEPERRLYKLDIPVIGLTGGIATGKSTVSKILKDKGLAIVDADKLVKEIYALPGTLAFIGREFPDVMQDGVIQFQLLRQKVFSDKTVKATIENLIYQQLPQTFQKAFEKLDRPKLLVYDVPLLFEKNLQDYCDVNVLVYAPRKIQRARLITRDGHVESMADNILDQQMDIEDKKLKAEFIIDNSGTEAELSEEINQFLRQVTE